MNSEKNMTDPCGRGERVHIGLSNKFIEAFAKCNKVRFDFIIRTKLYLHALLARSRCDVAAGDLSSYSYVKVRQSTSGNRVNV